MNLNPLATAGLVMIGIAQVWQAWASIQPTPQETHFRVVQEFCKKQAQNSGDGERVYVACMAELIQAKVNIPISSKKTPQGWGGLST